MQAIVIFCNIFFAKNLHISVIFCNFAPDFKNVAGKAKYCREILENITGQFDKVLFEN